MSNYTDTLPSCFDYYSNRKHVCASISMVYWTRALTRVMTVLASFRLLRSCHTDFHKAYTSFYSHYQWKDFLSPHILTCVYSLLFFFDDSYSIEWDGISKAFAICISLLVKNGKHFYKYLLIICISSEIVYSITMLIRIVWVLAYPAVLHLS